MENLPADHVQDQEQDQDDIIIKCRLETMAKAFFKDYEIIWHDPNVNSQENQQYLTQLENLCEVKTFTEWKEAESYLKAAKTICHVITSGPNGEVFVEEIFSSAHVPNIFTFRRDKEDHSTWTQDYKKILCPETKIEDAILKIQENLQEWQKQTSSLKFDLPAFAPVFNDWDKSQMNHLHLYLKVIPGFKNWKQAKQDILNLSKKIYSDKKITDFEENYNEYNKEAILRWYTQQSFLFKIVNNCLRIATSDSIQWARLLLKDIERAIKDQYNAKSKNFSGVLYRAACLSDKEWLSLKANVNSEIEMHGFLSTSKVKKIALNFMEGDSTQKVFITIIVPKGPIEDEQGFAEVDKFSEYPQEREVLFNVRSRFLIVEAEDEYSQNLPYRHLVLLYGAQGLRKYIAEESPMQQVSIQDVACSYCKVSTEKMFFMDLEKRIYACQKCLSNDTIAPFLCIPTKNASTIDIKGCLLMNSNQIQVPFYGYKCSKCEVKNQKRYFVCTDCGLKWCEDCFENVLSCMNLRHPIILENSSFSFWYEKMSENELNHLNFQSNFMRENNYEFQQAIMFDKTQEYQKAIEFYKIYIQQNEAKGKKSELATSYNNIGLIYETQGEYKKALKYHLKSLEIDISLHGENHPDVATSYNSIGLIYHTQGEYKKALEYHLKSLEIRRSVHRENHPDVATSCNNIGLIYKAQGEYQEALEYYSKSLEIEKSVHGENHPDIGISYNNIGLIYKSQGEYKSALEYSMKSLEIYISIHGENHPDVATSYNNIGLICKCQGEYKKALEYYLKSVEIRRSVYGENHPEVATSYNNIGSISSTQGEYTKALEYFLKSLEIKISVHGENHPDVATSYSNIGSIYKYQGEDKKALEYFLKSLGINISFHGENHPTVAISYNNIGFIYETQGEYEKALKYYLKSLETKISIHGENHPDVAMSYNNIGSIYGKQGAYNKGLEYSLKSLEIRKSAYGENHRDVAISYNNIGFIYETQGEQKSALQYYMKSLEIGKLVFEQGHRILVTLEDRISKLISIAQN